MDILINRLNDTGSGIGNINKKVVFVEKTVPGDIVEVKKIIKHKNYLEASYSRIIKNSSKRIQAACPYYEKCGGCQIMNLDYYEQLAYKKEKVINIFKKYGNITIKPNIIFDKEWHYRNKITLQVKKGKLGLFKSKSNEIVEIEKCLLISNSMNELIKFIKENIKLDDVNQIIIREADNQHMVVFKGNIDDKEAFKLISIADSIYINNRLIYGITKITTTLGNYTFKISKDSFFQVNHNQTIKLYNQIKKYLNKNSKILDLYCGTGSIGIYVSDNCKNILGVEINSQAIKDANLNKKINNIENISFKCGDVANVITSKDKYDTLIVDPPRNGLSKKTRKILLEISTNYIIYVSCNPITLARDIKELSSKYELKDITLFDLFPNTYHIESVTLLVCKSFI